jgi:hypothetical protein
MLCTCTGAHLTLHTKTALASTGSSTPPSILAVPSPDDGDKIASSWDSHRESVGTPVVGEGTPFRTVSHHPVAMVVMLALLLAHARHFW